MSGLPAPVVTPDPLGAAVGPAPLGPTLGDDVREVFRRARDPGSAAELRQLYLGAVEARLGRSCHRPELAERWRRSRPLRQVDDDEVLAGGATVGWVKELFNFYFRHDLYGELRRPESTILSSGSPDEVRYGLPPALKSTITTALSRDWYGYSDSRGRGAARRAVAALENQRVDGGPYDEGWVALTMGTTFAVACLADFVIGGARPAAPALCAIPNYPPLVAGVARRCDVRLVPLPTTGGRADLGPLIDAVRPDTPMVLVQTVINPTGTAVPEWQIARLVRACAASTIVVLDEAHECLSGRPVQLRCAERAQPNVIRASSMSKWFSIPGMKLGWLVMHPELMRDYYEYASTTYGGPPSLFYLLVETAARYESWLEADVATPGTRHLALFEDAYRLRRSTVQREYRRYRRHRARREADIVASRQQLSSALATAGCRVDAATHSINVSFAPPGCTNSYAWFRRCLQSVDVACFPGILAFDLADRSLRATTARAPRDLERAMPRLAAFCQGAAMDGG